jgi:hypothetical protein
MKKILATKIILVMAALFSFYHFQDTTTKIKLSQHINHAKRGPASMNDNRGLTVVIDQGTTAYLDEDTNIDTLIINGTLKCDETNAHAVVELKVKTITVNGTFECGTANKPYRKKLIISLKHSDYETKPGHKYRAILVNGQGQLKLFGDRKRSKWTRLAATAMPGQDYIEVQEDINQWSIGDKIVIAPTGYDYSEAEEFIISDIDSNNPHRIYLDREINFMHWGEEQLFDSKEFGTIRLNESAEVANLTRNILIRADESEFAISEDDTPDAQLGGHIMSHFGTKVYIDSVEFYKMGQAGIMMRYPFHWHYVANAPGQYIKNSSVHHSFQRCIVVHRTHQTLVENNVCYNFKGHGFFLEDGNEIDNTLINNLAIKAIAPSPSKVLLASDNLALSEGMGRFPAVSAFWISNPNNTVMNNTAAGSIGTGFWMSFEAEIKNSQGQVIARPRETATKIFDSNIAHSNKVGFTWDGARGWENANNPNNPDDLKVGMSHYSPPVTPTFRNLVAYKNLLTGIYFRGNPAIFDQAIVADNGWSFWMIPQIIRNSVIIGETNNQSPEIQDFYFNHAPAGRHRKTGVVIYDGPFEIDNTDFFNFSESPQTYTLQNGQTINSTVIPITSTGGSQKFVNVTRKLRFTPEPHHRMFLQSAGENFFNAFMLNATYVRDLDGSLAKQNKGRFITANRSTGVLPSHQCSEGGDSYRNFLICPSSYTESMVEFSSSLNSIATPFAVIRSDGKTCSPINEWSSIPSRPNNIFAIANSNQVTYEVLPRYQYEYYYTRGATVGMRINSEFTNINFPVIKIASFGKNCTLGNGAVQRTSLDSLKSSSVTAYFTQGEDFYVKLLPTTNYFKDLDIEHRAKLFITHNNDSFKITCDPQPLEKKIIGEITSVTRLAKTTKIAGWGCNYTHTSPVQVRLFARSLSHKNVRTQIAQMNSNQLPDSEMSKKCGVLSSTGRKFTFNISNQQLQNFTNHVFEVEGISNTGGQNLLLTNSGLHKVLQSNAQTPSY